MNCSFGFIDHSVTFCPDIQKLLLTLPNFQPKYCGSLTLSEVACMCGLTCSVCFPDQNSGVAILVSSLPAPLNPYPTRYHIPISNDRVASTPLSHPGMHMQEYLEGFLISGLYKEKNVLLRTTKPKLRSEIFLYYSIH